MNVIYTYHDAHALTKKGSPAPSSHHRYIIWGSLTNLKIAFFLHQRYTKLHHSKVWNIQTREMNAAFSPHNVTGFKGYLPRSPSSYPVHVRVVWNDNEAEGRNADKTISTSVSNPFPFLYLCSHLSCLTSGGNLNWTERKAR